MNESSLNLEESGVHLLFSLPINLLLIDSSFNIVYSNKCIQDRLGKILLSKSLLTIISKPERNRVEAFLTNAFNSEVTPLIAEGLTSASVYGWYKLKASELKNDGKIYLIVILEDVTQEILLQNDKSIQQEDSRLLNEYNNKLKSLYKRILSDEEREQKRISSYIHDTIIQDLGLMIFMQKALIKQPEAEVVLDTLETILNHSTNLLNDVRALIEELYPVVLYELGFNSALINVVDQYQRIGEFEINYDVNIDDGDLDKNEALIIYRIVKELLNNIIKHAKADHVSILIKNNDKGIFVSVSDNGIGIDNNKSGGIGLFSIYERIKVLGGNVKIESGDEYPGTLVEVYLPTLRLQTI